ncbi:MAG: hypothetical protein M1822_006192 [Bathelium mastoideum]|nr:MAG: hypothetical protein M1822_006192 [Bathelium mastoideum]
MVSKRSLPSKRNPLLAPEHTPQLEILVERRRLGRTHLDVKPGQVGVANATKKENLGVFDYAHLRVPLPTDLKGTGIFTIQPNTGRFPDAYFLMRRSTDGYVSATGMFKAAFPWASLAEETAERKYVRGLNTTADDEVAGNVWIPPETALELGAEYSMQPWLHALVDPEPVHQSSSDRIASPPAYRTSTSPRQPPTTRSAKAASNGTSGTLGDAGAAAVEPTPTRARTRRSVSPTKIAAPASSSGRKIASPRKPRAAKGSGSGSTRSASGGAAGAKEEAAAVAIAEEGGAPELFPTPATALSTKSIAQTLAEADESNDAEEEDDNKVTVGVETRVTVGADGAETTDTKVSVAMPRGAPELPLPDDADAAQLVQTAKEMVEQAAKLEGAAGADDEEGASTGSSSANKGKGKRGGKRKAEEMADGDEEEDGGEHALLDAVRPQKRARMTTPEVQKAKVRSRALIGLTATLAFGAAIPYIFG